MKKVFLLVVVSLLLVGPVQAQEKDIKVSLDVTYVSKWLSKGVEAYGSKGGLFKTLDIDLYDSGFGAKITHRNATSSGFVDNQRFDFRPYYKGKLFVGESYVTNYNVSVGYEYYPRTSRESANTTWEWIFAFSWPELIGNGWTPSYIAHYEYPASAATRSKVNTIDDRTGWVHRFLLGYAMNVEGLDNPLNLSGEIAYYDGLGGKVHDWGYTTFGASTKFVLSENLSFVPGIYHQITLDDNISDEKDITYTQLSMKYTF